MQFSQAPKACLHYNGLGFEFWSCDRINILRDHEISDTTLKCTLSNAVHYN